MLKVLLSAWALFLGMGLLMVGNGMQGTLLGIRGDIEEFSTFSMSLVMSAYFLGFLGGSRAAPEMIRRVGHVRVFAALASFISAVLILFPSVTEVWAWVLLRVVVGFCFSGVYVTAESWLNNATTTKNRGQALSLYMIVQMGGIVIAQAMLSLGDPAGFILFVIPSVLVSLSFAPILLSITPTPPFATTKPMDLRELYRSSPTGFIGMFLAGGMFAAQFGMAAVYGAQAGLSVAEIGTFVGAIFTGGLLLQYPVGWISDRTDRRILILGCSLIGSIACVVGAVLPPTLTVVVTVGFVVGGMVNPLYSLLIAYTADYLEYEDMASASGGLVFVNGLGAILGPVAIGALMSVFGPSGFWLFVAVLMAALAAYAGYRMTIRPAPSVADTGAFVSFSPNLSSVGLAAGQEWSEAQSDTDSDASTDTSDWDDGEEVADILPTGRAS